MFTRTTLVIAAALAAAAGWAADEAVVYNGTTVAPTGPAAVAKPGTDATIELKWDNNDRGGGWAWYTGEDSWVAQEFDISTVSSYNYIRYIRFNTYPNWPNGTYEGGRVGIYAFAGGSPGSILWGPEYRANTGADWNDLGVWWSLGAVTNFLAAWEQFYNYPNCDSWSVDWSGNTAHCWYYYNGWYHRPAPGGATYMIRAVVDDEHQNPGIAPSSLGCVKALYY